MIVGMLATAAVYAQEQTACSLAEFRNRDEITLKGEVFPTAHDTFLRPAGCSERVVLVYGDDPSLGTGKLAVTKDKKLRQYALYVRAEQKPAGVTICKECWKYRVTAELQGRLDIAPSAGWKKDAQSGKVIGIEGFGHPLPFTRYRLVISRVLSVEAVERAPAAEHPVHHEH